MDFTEKTIQRDIKYSGRIFTVTQDIVELPNGKTSTRDLVFHTGAVAVLVIRDGKMLLVRQYRKPLEMHFLEIPAGKLDSKEEVPLEAAKRELEEETNLVAEEWVKMMEMVSTPGFCDEKITLFQAKNVTVKENAKPADEDEFVEILWLPLEEVMQKIQSGEISDAKTIIAAQYAWMHKGE
jgi:MutT/NUDIX family protein